MAAVLPISPTSKYSWVGISGKIFDNMPCRIYDINRFVKTERRMAPLTPSQVFLEEIFGTNGFFPIAAPKNNAPLSD